MDKASVIAVIERSAPLSIAADWDHSGVQVPALRSHIERLAVCLDPTPQALEKAVSLGADMVLSHHPLSLSPRFLQNEDAYLQAVRILIKADVLLYSAHTSLDANIHGPVAWFAKALGMTMPSVLEHTGEMQDSEGNTYECGFGQIGDLAKPVSLQTILSASESVCPRLVGASPDNLNALTRIAICPGSGSSLAQYAAEKKASLLITGDLKYHTALEVPLPILDVGHFCLEETMMRHFAHQLTQELHNVDVLFVESKDPFSNPCTLS